MELLGGERGWSFYSTGFDAGLAYVVAVGAMLGMTRNTDLALDAELPALPPHQVPEVILRRAAPSWGVWWEATMAEYRDACFDSEVRRSQESCEGLADPKLMLVLNRVRGLFLQWFDDLVSADTCEFPARRVVEDAELAYARPARPFTIRWDLLPVTGPVVLTVCQDPAHATARLLISSGEARRPERLSQIVAETLDNVAF